MENNKLSFSDKLIDLGPEHYAAIYARQSIKGGESSIRTQIELGKDILKEKGLLLYRIYSEKESATDRAKGIRIQFEQLKTDIRLNKFKTLIVFRRDRLARNVKEFIEIKNLLKKHNVKVIYTNLGEFQPNDGFASDLIENIMAGIDEMEAALIYERCQRGREKKRQKGEYSAGGVAPFGYERVKTHRKRKGKLSLIPGYKEIIKDIFNEYVKTNGNASKVAKLMKDRILLLENNRGKKKIRKINHQFISNIINNPIYAGYIMKSADIELHNVVSNGSVNYELLIECINVEPALIDGKSDDMKKVQLRQWEEAVIIRHSKSRRPQPNKEVYLYEGLLYCYECNTPVTLKKGMYKCKSANCTYLSPNVVKESMITFLSHLYDKNTDCYNQNYIEDYDFDCTSDDTIGDNLLDCINIYFDSSILKLKQKIMKEEQNLKAFRMKSRKRLISMLDSGEIGDLSTEQVSKIVEEEKSYKLKIYELGKEMHKFEDRKNCLENYIKNLSKNEMRKLLVDISSDLQAKLKFVFEKVYISGRDNKCKVFFKKS